MANFIFHRTLPPKVVSDFEYEKYLSTGEWARSPDFFNKASPDGLGDAALPDEDLKVLKEDINFLGEVLKELKESSSNKKTRGRPKRIVNNESVTENNK